VETDLRWAAMLKRRLVAVALPAVLRTVEQNLHRHLHEEPADEILRLVQLALRVIMEAIEGLDPGRGQHLERVCVFATDRALAQQSVARPGGRAAARHAPGSVLLPRRQRRCAPWQTWLDPLPHLEDHLDVLEEGARRVIALRYGWWGSPPMTLVSLAEWLEATPAAVAAQLREAERLLREEL
jgi:hypothetical protein